MTICGNAFNLNAQFNQVIQILFYLRIMFSIRKPDQLSIAILMILVTDQAKSLKIGSIKP